MKAIRVVRNAAPGDKELVVVYGEVDGVAHNEYIRDAELASTLKAQDAYQSAAVANLTEKHRKERDELESTLTVQRQAIDNPILARAEKQFASRIGVKDNAEVALAGVEESE